LPNWPQPRHDHAVSARHFHDRHRHLRARQTARQIIDSRSTPMIPSPATAPSDLAAACRSRSVAHSPQHVLQRRIKIREIVNERWPASRSTRSGHPLRPPVDERGNGPYARADKHTRPGLRQPTPAPAYAAPASVSAREDPRKTTPSAWTRPPGSSSSAPEIPLPITVPTTIAAAHPGVAFQLL
jgi:hypothetical protein